MKKQKYKGSLILVKNKIFNDDQVIRKGTIGRFVRYDGWLLVINFLGDNLCVRPSDAICLDGK